ncbi:MAG: diguanylate cyclase [Sphingomonadales bacterium]|nr:diguanylate cyclase [Sphingomonadales bacterium]
MAKPRESRLPTLRDLLARAHLRLILFAVLLATASLVLSGGLVISNYGQRNLELVARTVAYTIEPAVLFEDREAIRTGIVPVATGRGIARVEVRNAKGQLIAEWHDPATGVIATISRSADGVFWAQPAVDKVHRGEEHLAEVRVYGSSEGILRYGLVGAIIALSCLLLTIVATRILARRLQSEVVTPLEHVAEVAHAVRRDRAFERRVPASGIAEIDRFGRDFNALLAELQGWHAGLTSQNAELAWRASHDGLTGLGNRELFDERIVATIAEAQRTGSGFALVYLDIDRFKLINDEHGHDAGDAALIAVAERMRSAIRQGDYAFRMGGDEFAIILAPLPGEASIEGVLARIRASLDLPYRLPCGRVVPTALSIGVALYPQNGETPDDLVKNADMAMYKEKRIRQSASDEGGTGHA